MFDKILKLPVYIHLLAIMAVGCIVVYVTLKGIDSYTNHNQAVKVPDVRGLQIEDAIPFLNENLLNYTILDSIHTKELPPGAIVELMPEANSKVKKNRIIYITVNAKSEETVPIPVVKDISYRQASALLKARGFVNVEWKYVSSDFRDLTLGVEYGGKIIESGTRVPLTAKLILIIGDGHSVIPADTLVSDDPNQEEKVVDWF